MVEFFLRHPVFIWAKVKEKVTPTPIEKDEINKMVDEAVFVTKKIIKPLGLGFTLAGSFIRDTWMADKKEFEIFILFPEGAKREVLEKKGLEIGKKIVRMLKGKHVIAYAEHPYVRARVGDFDIDIVPCYKLNSAKSIKSAVDRTPFHNKWIEKNLPIRLSSEVRLLKKFAKVLGVYGSDTRVQGFSGYLCELLIVHYGSFKALMKQASKWEPGKIMIDLAKYHKGAEIPQDLKKKFKGHPFIVIDPVDPRRNVAAAFSPDNFVLFSNAAKKFITKPNALFFFPKPEKVLVGELSKKMKKRGTKFLLLEMPRPDVIDDVLWPQLRRTGSRINNILKENEFQVINWEIHSDIDDFGRGVKAKKYPKSWIMLELGVWKLPKIRKVRGPPAFIEARASEFRKKYEPIGKVWVDKDRIMAQVQREFLDANGLLKAKLGESLAKLKANGIASHIAKQIAKKKLKICDSKHVLKVAKTDRDFGIFLKWYLKK